MDPTVTNGPYCHASEDCKIGHFSTSGRDPSADLQKSAAERFASVDGKISAADRFICWFGQNLEDFDCQKKNMSPQGEKKNKR